LPFDQKGNLDPSQWPPKGVPDRNLDPTQTTPPTLPFDQKGNLDPSQWPPKGVPDRNLIRKIESTRPDRVLGRFLLDTVTGLLGEATAGTATSGADAERIRREFPAVGYGEQALNWALALFPVEKVLGYTFKGVRSLLAPEAKGSITTAEKRFLKDLDESLSKTFDESFKATEDSADKAAAPHLARGNFGEKIAADTLVSEGHCIVSYKPSISGTNQGGIDIVTIKDGVVYFVDNKALTRSGNVSSVTALTTNFAKNKEAVLNEVRALLKTNISQDEKQILEQTIKSIESGNYKRVVTNANLVPDTKLVGNKLIEPFLTGISSKLQSQGIEFKDVFAKQTH